jgi:hypothetical protein
LQLPDSVCAAILTLVISNAFWEMALTSKNQNDGLAARGRGGVVPLKSDGLSWSVWELIREPGAYVELSTGDLYRFSAGAVGPRSAPGIIRESLTPILLLRISPDPTIGAEEARVLCARHNIQPNF